MENPLPDSAQKRLLLARHGDEETSPELVGKEESMEEVTCTMDLDVRRCDQDDITVLVDQNDM